MANHWKKVQNTISDFHIVLQEHLRGKEVVSPKLLKERKEQVAELRLQPPVSACVLSHFSHVQLFAIPWTIANQSPLSMGFSRKEYWSGLPFPSPGDIPNPRIKPAPYALAGRFFTTEPYRKPSHNCFIPKCVHALYLMFCHITINKLPDTFLNRFTTFMYAFNSIYLVIFHGEGNGTPLQYSCLENPMDGGAW